MSKRNKWLQKFFAVLTVIIFMLSLSVLTAYADPGDDGGEAVADDGGEIDIDNADGDSGDNADGDSSQPDDSSSSSISDRGVVDNEPTPADNGDSYNDGADEPSTTAPISIPEQINEIRNKYLGDDEDSGEYESDYTPNQNLNNLPTVAAEEVAAATAEPLPDVEVSDATLFSGIIMWVCVAVGISVVAGVMVSKRTHRRGA